MEIIIGAAFILDLIFGDPYFLPHPICLIGKTISFLEKKFRKKMKNLLVAGTLLWICVCALSFTIPLGLLILAFKINFYFGIILHIYFCFQILATKSLKKESMKVYYKLKEGNIQEGRKYLSYIVGRDTAELNEKQIVKATVETVAENTTDGVIAPLMFMAIGGAPLGFLYKAINTMDSMLGYKNEKYFYFGRCAAKVDDVVNFIPARLSAMFMIAVSYILKLDGKNAFKMYKRDKKNHSSPNSAQTESVCAGALNIQLGGDAIYFGKTVKKKTIGDANREIKIEDIKISNKLMVAAAVMGAIIFTIIGGLIWI